MKSITLETIYKKGIRLKRDVDEINKALIEEPVVGQYKSIRIVSRQP